MHHVSYADVYFHLEHRVQKTTYRTRCSHEALEILTQRVVRYLDEPSNLRSPVYTRLVESDERELGTRAFSSTATTPGTEMLSPTHLKPNLLGAGSAGAPGPRLCIGFDVRGLQPSDIDLTKKPPNSPSSTRALEAQISGRSGSSSSLSSLLGGEQEKVDTDLLASAFFEGNRDKASGYRLVAIVFPIFALCLECWLGSIRARRGACHFVKIYFLSGSHQRLRKGKETFSTESAARCLVRFVQHQLKTRFRDSIDIRSKWVPRPSAFGHEGATVSLHELEGTNIQLHCIHSGPGVRAEVQLV